MKLGMGTQRAMGGAAEAPRPWQLPRHWLCCGIAFATLFIAGCASNTRAIGPLDAQTAVWQGRLSVKVFSDPPESSSASFELTGNPQTGSLTLFTPLGSTVAELRWTPAQATLRTRGEPQHFGSLQALVQHATGTDIPIAALFAWLQGDQATAPGWEADLQNRADGRISARKLAPAPAAELKVILDRP